MSNNCHCRVLALSPNPAWDRISARPLWVHCSHGKDRTGLVVALYRVAHNNYCKDNAYKEMNDYGHNRLLFGLKNVLYSDDVKEHADCIKLPILTQ
ncbi:tyrosine-protein phosphatase [Pseudomonas fluorescens]|uniref:tyrosine-protein phosphatase n=1 Tax=Pseudomonas fluorescens TaxID=294 RepID=UPI0012D707FD